MRRRFRKVWTIDTENVDQRINFFWLWWNWGLISFLQIFLNILEYIWCSLHLSFLFIGMMGYKEVTWSLLCRRIKKPCNHNPNIKPEIFKFNKKKIVKRHSLKPKTNWNFKVLFRININTITWWFFFQFNNNLGIVMWYETKL